ncbi:MAG: hypothetical protein KDA84_17195 [Planctomycetaceae bacterium]|nr:hypothetical protein [Planctomycetaceae bacterium]
MNAAPSSSRWFMIVSLLLALGILTPALRNPLLGEKALWAQEEKTPASVPADTETNPAPESSGDLPHTRFLLDYVIVLALIAVALFAVCRSSRRV